MDNENNSAVEETVRPVKKLVLKRKPVVKKAPRSKETAQEQETPQAEKPAPEVPVAEAPVVEVKAESPEVAEDSAQKKRKGRPAKQQKTKDGDSKKKASKEAEEPEEPKETPKDTPKEAPKEAPAQPETQKEEPQEEREQKHFNNNRNQNQHNNNNQKNKNNKFNNGKQDQRNNQKKPMTMEDIAIPEAEYQEHLANRLIVSDVVATPADELKERLAAMEGTSVEDYAEFKKQEVIVELLKAFSRNGGVIYATGTLEILSDGYGFLRSPNNSYLSGPEDVYVSAGIIKFLNLKTGDTIEGLMRTPKDNERFFAISRIASVNGDAPIVAKTRTSFDNLIPLYPDQRINLETERTDNDVSMRIINLFCPIGKGQRALITAPPRTGKTILLQQIANSITTNHPEIKLMVLLVDERPEEVTDMRRNVRGEVIASTFDEQATRHVTVAEMVIEKAKRLVEHGKDVVILLDSITRLARAYNQTVPASGKILSGGVDSNALHKPKRFFGAARNIENGGSLTIIASALIETGSRMDEVIFEEFKGTGNSEIVLDRRMADRRLYPAINIKKSGTRREDLLLEKDEAARIWLLRNAINGLEDLEMTEFLIDKMRKTKNNEAFLRSMNTGIVPEF
jgi:transcription termination factor Rho